MQKNKQRKMNREKKIDCERQTDTASDRVTEKVSARDRQTQKMRETVT